MKTIMLASFFTAIVPSLSFSIFKKKEFITIVLIGLVLAFVPTLVVVTHAVPYSHMGSKEKGSNYGSIASIQHSEPMKFPEWILSGNWVTNIINKTMTDFNQTNPSKFDATFTMTMVNGSSRHQHHISNFSLTDVKTENDTVTYKGLATVTLKDGPVADVPTEIKIINNNLISIWFHPGFEPTKFEKHFGETPIYGTVFKTNDMESKPVAPQK
ncbi:MAG TPA: hypothetical protein VI146_07345 [Nitrososphaeraceae archaeon]